MAPGRLRRFALAAAGGNLQGGVERWCMARARFLANAGRSAAPTGGALPRSAARARRHTRTRPVSAKKEVVFSVFLLTEDTWPCPADAPPSREGLQHGPPAPPPAPPLETSLLPIPAIGSIARGTQRLNCSMRGSMERALNNSAVECRVLWNQLPELVKDYPQPLAARDAPTALAPARRL